MMMTCPASCYLEQVQRVVHHCVLCCEVSGCHFKTAVEVNCVNAEMSDNHIVSLLLNTVTIFSTNYVWLITHALKPHLCH